MLGKPRFELAHLGACADPAVDPRLFFPNRGQMDIIKKAKAICADCPVRSGCLEYALTPPLEMHGVWGGKSDRERRRLRRAQRRTDAA
jgi:WhiB family redox-sensing transcriptional regulator